MGFVAEPWALRQTTNVMTNVIRYIFAYDVCRLCQIITFVAYDVCRISGFVPYDVCRLIVCVAY